LVYFSAYTPDSGIELWSFDGTSATMVADLHLGSDSSSPRALIAHEGRLYFAANAPETGVEMYSVSPGEVPVLVSDINPGEASSNAQAFFSVGNRLVFAADDGEHGLELWDWTDADGVGLVADIDEGPEGSDPHAMIVFDDEWAYFTARTAQYGFELWRTNGTTTEMLLDIWPGSNGGTPNDYAVLDDQVCFSAADGIHGREFWCAIHADLTPILSRTR